MDLCAGIFRRCRDILLAVRAGELEFTHNQCLGLSYLIERPPSSIDGMLGKPPGFAAAKWPRVISHHPDSRTVAKRPGSCRNDASWWCCRR